MLSKNICIRCRNMNKNHQWNYVRNHDDISWDLDGFVLCPLEVMKMFNSYGAVLSTSTKDEPPVWCKYTLEHIIDGDNKCKKSLKRKVKKLIKVIQSNWFICYVKKKLNSLLRVFTTKEI